MIPAATANAEIERCVIIISNPKHHEAKHHEKAAHHSQLAEAHHLHARHHHEEAIKSHHAEHGSKP
jgi:hypothetical protein